MDAASPKQEAQCPGCAARDRRIARLEAQVARLSRQVEALSRSAKRQAAPFSKGDPEPNPERPGRKAGPAYGNKAHRPIPPGVPDQVLDAPLPAACPCCGGELIEESVAHQHQLEIPRKPIHRRFDIHVGRCARCGRRVHGRHEWQTSDALGAAAAQLGPDAQAAVVELNKTCGLSHGKVAAVMGSLLGIDVSRGGVAQAMLRAARRCTPAYEAIVAALPAQPALSPDETSWRIGGRGAWLHVFAGERLTCYAIESTRGAEVAAALLGWDYPGRLSHDGWAPYDRFHDALHQTCLNHLTRRCDALLEGAIGAAVLFPRQVKDLLGRALGLRDRRDAGAISPRGLAIARGRLENELDRLLAWTRSHEGNERFAAHLWRHRPQVLAFLWHPGMEATNWRAEQALRPAVVNRKVWGGSRTDAGATAQAVLMSVLRTATQQGQKALDWLSRTLCGHAAPLNLQPAGP